MKTATVKSIAKAAIAVLLGSVIGFGLGVVSAKVKATKVTSCSADKFVLTVGQAEAVGL